LKDSRDARKTQFLRLLIVDDRLRRRAAHKRSGHNQNTYFNESKDQVTSFDMPEAEETVKSSQADAHGATVVPWVDFLETHPPNNPQRVTGMGRHMTPFGPNYVINAPDLT
jgi:hypothetical protein